MGATREATLETVMTEEVTAAGEIAEGVRAYHAGWRAGWITLLSAVPQKEYLSAALLAS
jgi:hypothetical protein